MPDRPTVVTLTLIATMLAATLIVDFGIVPPGPRLTAVEGSPLLLLLLGLNILTIVIAFRLPRPEQIAYVAAVTSIVLCAFPAYLLLAEDPVTGTSTVLLRRALAILFVWVFALVGIERRRMLRSAETLRTELERQVAQRTRRLVESARAARIVETRLRHAQRIARLGHWERDLRTDELWWSDETFHLLGLSPGDVEPSYEAFLERLHPDDRPSQRELTERVSNLHWPRTADLRVVLPDGSLRHIRTHAGIETDDDSKPAKIVGTIQDITSWRSLEIEVAELMQRLDALASAAFDGIIVIENDAVAEIGEALASKLGYPVDAIVGRKLTRFLAPGGQDESPSELGADALDSHELVFVRPDGTTLRVEAFSTSVTVGERELVIMGLRDVSRRLELEREIVDATERERKRIGYELRENLGQLLVSHMWSVQALARRLAGTDPGDEDGRQLVAQMERIIAETHELSATITPQIPDTPEIYPALKALTVDVERRTGARCELRCGSRDELGSRERSAHVYRIAEEAVRNAIELRAASHIELSFERRDNLYVLSVVDDGKSADSADASGESTLRNLHYRARLINGVVALRRRPSGGRQLECTFAAT